MGTRVGSRRLEEKDRTHKRSQSQRERGTKAERSEAAAPSRSYSSAAAKTFSFPKKYTDLLPPAFRQARFVTAWRKPRKLGDLLRYRITTTESASSLALADGDAIVAEDSVEEWSEGSDDADFFHCGDFYH